MDSVNNPLSTFKTGIYIIVNSLLFDKYISNFLELFRCQFELFALKIHVVFTLNRDQMDMRMRYFEA